MRCKVKHVPHELCMRLTMGFWRLLVYQLTMICIKSRGDFDSSTLLHFKLCMKCNICYTYDCSQCACMRKNLRMVTAQRECIILLSHPLHLEISTTKDLTCQHMHTFGIFVHALVFISHLIRHAIVALSIFEVGSIIVFHVVVYTWSCACRHMCGCTIRSVVSCGETTSWYACGVVGLVSNPMWQICCQASYGRSQQSGIAQVVCM